MKFNYSASNGRIWTLRTESYVQHTPMMMMMMMMMKTVASDEIGSGDLQWPI